MKRFFFLYLCFLVIPSLAICSEPKVAWVDLIDSPKPKIGKLIESLGYKGEDVTEKIIDERFQIKSVNILVFASFCTSHPSIKDFFTDQEENLQKFVRNGGVVIVFAQRTKNREVESWLLPSMTLMRGEQSFKTMEFVHREHPLFSSPNAISHRRFMRDWNSFDLARQPFRLVSRGWILAAENKRGKNPWCVEFGWGRGRVIFYACSPELSDNQPPETQRLARDLVENALSYGTQVVRGKPQALPDHAIVVEKRAGFAPKTTKDSDKNNFSFESQINQATDRGISYLLAVQEEDGSWGSYGVHDLGPTALCAVALMGCGVNKYKKQLQKAKDFILRAAPDKYSMDDYTYDISLCMMAMDAYGAPMFERFELEKLPPDKREAFKFKRDLSEKERAFMARCLEWLVKIQNKQNGYWTYQTPMDGHVGDLSNTQFAILGLKAASRCGMAAPKQTWLSIINGLLTAQAETGPKVSLPDFRSYDQKSGKPKFYITPCKARSWGYTPFRTGDVGSRCAMGISSLLIAQEGLYLHYKTAGSKTASRVRQGVKDGLAFLWTNWSVTENPNNGETHYYYYLYALERVGVLMSRKYLGDRDWYKEGAVQLLKRQRPDGSWIQSPIQTSFALMFLKRSTPPPVITVSK